MQKSDSTLSSLSRFRINDEHLVADSFIRKEIAEAFAQKQYEIFNANRIRCEAEIEQETDHRTTQNGRQ